MRKHKSLSSISPLAAMLGESGFAPENGLLTDLLHDIPDAILLIGVDEQIVYRNKRAADLFGIEAASHARLTDLFPPDDVRGEEIKSLWARLERQGRIENYETQLLTKETRVIDTIASLTAMHDYRQRMIGYSAVIKDITQIKDTERRIARRNSQLLAVNAVAEAVTELAGGVPLLDRVLDAVLRVTALNAGCVHLLDEDTESLILVAKRHISPRAAELLHSFELGEGIIGQTAILTEALTVTDTNNDARLARGEIAAEKIGAIIAVPLIAREGVRGVLTLFHDVPRPFTVHEQGMLTAIAQQVGVALDRARLFDEVTSAHQEWKQTFDAMTDGVSIHAPSGKIRRANQSLATLFNTSPAALVGVRCCELYHESPKPRPDCTIMRTVTARTGQSVELHDRVRGRILRVTTDPVIDAENNRVRAVVCTTRDVTEEKLIERRLIQQERVSAIGEIAAGIAPEVGTPLNIISANVEYLLRRKNVSTEATELEAIREQTQNITTLVRQLLDFARDLSPTFAPVNINNLIERTLGLLAHSLNNSSVHCELNLAPYLSTVDGDAAQLQQVLFNIITNARQAMQSAESSENAINDLSNAQVASDETTLKDNGLSDETSHKKIIITTDTALMPIDSFPRPHIIIKIRDTGCGIPSDALPHVFKPFFTANKEGGTGLGLAISHRIIQRHLGALTIENTTPHGALVRIRLPLAQDCF